MPDSISVGPITWAIDNDMSDADADDYGLTRHLEGRISVRAELPVDLQRETILHETLHGCHFLLGEHPDKEVTFERAISILSPILLGVLRDNPALTKFLTTGA